MVLNSSSRDARWEASKALIAIRDPIAAPVLAHQLCDEDNDLRWVAAEGLATLGEPGLRAVLTAAIRHARDPEFCQAVRHAIEEFHRHGIHSEMLKPVIDACKSAEPGVAIPVAAYQALESL
jgi:HEAT repeat protein